MLVGSPPVSPAFPRRSPNRKSGNGGRSNPPTASRANSNLLLKALLFGSPSGLLDTSGELRYRKLPSVQFHIYARQLCPDQIEVVLSTAACE